MSSKELFRVSLKFDGNNFDNTIDFYDVGRALVGFQRSLALTTHLVVTCESGVFSISQKDYSSLFSLSKMVNF